jgi:hypothetical protein
VKIIEKSAMEQNKYTYFLKNVSNRIITSLRATKMAAE